jgi:hypothetical protein
VTSDDAPDITRHLDRAVEGLVRCPIGGAFLAYVDANATVAEAVTPRIAFALAAEAVNELNPWHSDHERIETHALEFGQKLRGLARELLAHPGSAWWSAPYGGEQVWVGHHGHPHTRPPAGASPPTWQITSRVVDGSSCLEVVAARSSEWRAAPVHRVAVEPIQGARVLEVGSPGDWHQLCLDFPRAVEGILEPDWAEAARRWDGVHLSFLGLLSTPLVRVETADGASLLPWSWDSEGTRWLRSELIRPSGEATLLMQQPMTNPFSSTLRAGIDPGDRSTVLLQAGYGPAQWWRRWLRCRPRR